MGTIGIRPMSPSDWPDVEQIYRAGIATGQATFESEPPPSWQAFASGKLPHLMLVALEDSIAVGWAAAGPVSARVVYRGVVEHSVYVAPRAAVDADDRARPAGVRDTRLAAGREPGHGVDSAYLRFQSAHEASRTISPNATP